MTSLQARRCRTDVMDRPRAHARDSHPACPYNSCRSPAPSGSANGLTRLDAEAGNLRAALGEAVRRAAAGQAEEAVRLATALSWWRLLRGRLTEARGSLPAVIAATSASRNTAPELAFPHAAFAFLTGDHPGATVLADADTDADAVPDPVRRARAL